MLVVAHAADWEAASRPSGVTSTDDGSDRMLPAVRGSLVASASGAVLPGEPHLSRATRQANSTTVGGQP